MSREFGRSKKCAVRRVKDIIKKKLPIAKIGSLLLSFICDFSKENKPNDKYLRNSHAVFYGFQGFVRCCFLQLAVYTYTCIIANKKEVPHVSTMSEMEYTKVLMSVHDELGDEFKQLWMRDELESLRNELITAVNNAKKEISTVHCLMKCS